MWPTGISQKTATYPASPCTSGIIPASNTRTDGSEKSSAVPVRKSYCEHETPMPSLFGESSLTVQDRLELIALFSETKAASDQATLSDRLTLSLITSGLVNGITPMSVRQKLKAAIPDFVFYLPDGSVVAQQETGFSYLKKHSKGASDGK